MLHCDHVIELVAKAAVAYKKKQDKELKVEVSERYFEFLISYFPLLLAEANITF